MRIDRFPGRICGTLGGTGRSRDLAHASAHVEQIGGREAKDDGNRRDNFEIEVAVRPTLLNLSAPAAPPITLRKDGVFGE